MPNQDESAELGEKISSGSTSLSTTYLTLPKAIEFGQYEPEYLATFPEWHKLNKHSQFELIKQGLDNRRRQLTKQWAEINNVLDFSKKPYLRAALQNLEKRMEDLNNDRERLYVEYSLA